MTTDNKRLTGILLAIIGLLLLPAVAMVFSDAVQWTLFDFGVAGALLLAAGLTYELFARRGGSGTYRITVGIVVAVLLVVVWLELAVGLFGTRWAGS